MSDALDEIAPLLRSLQAVTVALGRAQQRRRFRRELCAVLRLPEDATDARILQRARALAEILDARG